MPPPPAPLLPVEQAWAATLPARPAADAAMDPARIYVPLVEGGTIALDRDTGVPAWTNPLGTPWPILLAPEGVVLVTTDEAAILDPATGQPRWRVALPGRTIAPGIVTGHLLVVALENGRLAGLHTGDGSVVWSVSFPNLAAPILFAADATTIYLTKAGSEVAAVAADTGAIRWRGTLKGELSPPAVGRERVFVGSTANSFYALDSATGQLDWAWQSKMVGGDVIGSAVDGDLVFYVGLDNLLHAVNRGNGNQRWKQPTLTRPTAPPLAFGGIVVLFGLSPALSTFNATTGAAIGTYVIPTAAGATTGSLPKGPPLIDPVLRPFRVAIAVITADGRALGLRPTGMLFREAAPVPLPGLPGRPLQRDRLPTVTTQIEGGNPP